MARGGDVRGHYVRIAARRFAERGFDGVSLSVLAEDAGVTRQALLHFFSTKERLYGEVLAALSERLSAKIDAIEAPTPEARLKAYFDAHARGALVEPDDARLVIRALLESDPGARVWPLKAHLDKLVALTLQTRRWRGASAEEALTGLYQVIGAIQYFAISGPTFSGMLGEGSREAMEAAFLDNVGRATEEFVGGA